MTLSGSSFIVFEAPRALTILRRDGKIVARTAWPHARIATSDSGVSVSPGGRLVAFRRSNARPGARSATAAVYVLRRGERRARPLFRHRLRQVGCAVGATMAWHGHFLLYGSYDGRLAVVNGVTGDVRGLNRLAAALPTRSPTEQARVSWL
jgi:hypothetical protein